MKVRPNDPWNWSHYISRGVRKVTTGINNKKSQSCKAKKKTSEIKR
jgi:hypothetical protein